MTAARDTASNVRRDVTAVSADLDDVLAGLAEHAVAAGHTVDRLEVREPAPIDLDRTLAAALERPRGTAALRELARGARTAAIVTSDATRAVPTARLLGPVLDALTAAGLSPDGIDVIVGTGAHRGATDDEIAAMLGPRWAGRLRVANHDTRAADLVVVGTLPDGHSLRIDRRVAAADVRIAFGKVEPHEFAGFTGGRKSILPAVADYDTTIRNHSVARLAHPRVRSGVLDGNPIHEEMVCAARLARLDFIVNVVLDRELRPLAVAAGDVEAAHAELVAFIRGYAVVSPPAGPDPDVIVTGPGEPLDINLYQSVKALVGVEALLDRPADSPAVVLLSRCWDGTGSEEMLEPFRAVAGRGSAATGDLARAADAAAARAREVLAGLERSYTIEKDHTYFIARVNTHGAPVVACCPGVADEDLAVLGWLPAAGPSEALRLALEHASRGGRGTGAAGQRAARVLFCPRPQRALLVPWGTERQA